METYHGHVRTPSDAILLFEACRIGLLPRVQRRLSEKERQQIRSGSVFVWDEREAGMRRWTDGKSWSASRVSGSFLTYREMEGKRGGSLSQPAPKRASGKSPEGSVTGESDGEGPDGYRYKPDGLMKQSFSITTSSGQHLHLISYFTRSNNLPLTQPSGDPNLRHIRPPKNMYPESTINEAQAVPAVTRGPLPGSPYSPSVHLGSASPYSRPTTQQQPVYVPVFPPTPPNGTPPFQHAYYGHPQIHYYPYGQVVYAPGYPPPPPGHAPHMGAPGVIHAAPGHPLLARHTTYPGPPTPYAMGGPSPPHLGHPNGPHAPPPASAIPEHGPQLPALHSVAATKPPSPLGIQGRNDPPALEPRPDAAPRTIPKIGSILNGAMSDKPSLLRTASRSPNGITPTARDFHPDRVTTSMSSATDNQALDKLNKNMFVRT